MLSHRSLGSTVSLLLLLLIFTLTSPTHSQSADDESSTQNSEPTQTTPKSKPINPNTDWGSFYDPKNVFCGQYDCYKILGFDYFQWGDDPPSLKEITKSYRSLSRMWHPDKNKAKGAREKFVVST
jgi:DnaJ family protein C protein 25